jgi:pyridoxal phosphate enzyme (YggS family)
LSERESILRKNLDEVERRITAACQRAGRKRDEVTLVAVTKYIDIETARALFRLGITDLGESRPQELWHKAEAIPEARWHQVGHLQRNKVERTLPLNCLIHSVDSLRLLETLEAEARKQQRPIEVLLEFNLSGEANKHGFQRGDVPAIIPMIQGLRSVRVTGLMTMAAQEAGPAEIRQTFAALRELRDELRMRMGEPNECRQLSMGMTNDFEIAIEEGATMVRIGSALFYDLEGQAS